MKDKDGNIIYYNTEEEARNICGLYEFVDAWIMKLIYNHKEENQPRSRGDRKTQNAS